MLINEHIAIITPKVLLVPYSPHHVPTYHEWMQDEELQKATASEPLTLGEEYAMQRSWRCDADKLTFIACLPPLESTQASGEISFQAGADTPERMFGDVNLFLSEDEEESIDEAQQSDHPQSVIGEVEIMIARKDLQGQGWGQAVLLAFLWYIISHSEEIVQEYVNRAGGNVGRTSMLRYLRVKVDSGNVRSIRLFERVGFERISEHPNYFGELELRSPIEDGNRNKLKAKLRDQNMESRIVPYSLQ